MNRYHERLPSKVRKNAVHAVELVMTASPEFAGDWDKYLKACDQWALETFGGKENLLHIAHHKDESTPHCHILFMPLHEGKLNAKHWVGGHRDRMVELQNDFHKKVGFQFELDRGQPRAETKARHSHHTLAGKTAELDEREKSISAKEVSQGEREKSLENFTSEFKSLMGMKPSDVQKMKTLVDKWDKATPSSLRVIARDIEQSGAATVGEYRFSREAERKQQQKQGFSR